MMSDRSLGAEVARELMDGSMRGFNDEGVSITSTGPLERTEDGGWGFDISGGTDTGIFSAFVTVELKSESGYDYDGDLF